MFNVISYKGERKRERERERERGEREREREVAHITRISRRLLMSERNSGDY